MEQSLLSEDMYVEFGEDPPQEESAAAAGTGNKKNVAMVLAGVAAVATVAIVLV